VKKKTVARISIALAVVLLLCTFLSQTVYTLSLTDVTTVMQKMGIITHSDETIGHFDWDVNQVKAASDWTITELFVADGDTVREGTPLFRVEARDSELAQAELILALLRAQNRLDDLAETTPDEQGAGFARAVADAAKALEQAQSSFFDGYNYQNAVADAELELLRRTEELSRAELALADALDEPREGFDSYPYQVALEEARIMRDRRDSELKAAEAGVTAAEGASYGFFDDFQYQNAITAARTAQSRAQTAYDDALFAYGAGSPEEQTALQALDDATTALDIAVEAMSRAKTAKNREISVQRETAIDAAQAEVDAALAAAEDAARTVTRAEEDWVRAVAAFETSSAENEKTRLESLTDIVETARTAVSDATLALTRGEEGADRAGAGFETDRQSRILSAREALSRATEDLALALGTDTVGRLSRQMAEAEAELAIAQMQLNAFAQAMPAEGIVRSHCDGTVSGIVARAGDQLGEGELVLSVVSADGILPLVFRLPAEKGMGYEVGAKGNCEAIVFSEGADGQKQLARATSLCTIVKIAFLPDSDEIEFTASHSFAQIPASGAAVMVNLTRKGSTRFNLVPSECVYSDAAGKQHYVLAVRTRDGLFGTETYIQKVEVRVEETNGKITSIRSEGLFDALTEFVRDTADYVRDREVVFVSEKYGRNW